MKFRSNVALASVVILSPLSLAGELDVAFSDLKAGREYRDELNQKVRSAFVGDFLNGGTGTPVERHPVKLRRAVDRAIAIREDSAAGSTEFDQAWIIANEALEASLYGYLSAGNLDLLNGTRLAFPNTGDVSLGYTEGRQDPVEQFSSIENDNTLKSLLYAQLYFQTGIKETISFIQADPESKIRSTDLTTLEAFPYFTRWNNPAYLPHPRFEDNKFNDSEDNASLTAASLLGKSIRRHGGTAITIADRMWRSAFNDPRGQDNREEILSEASEHLRCQMHSQFLASLPIAATLSDGQSAELDSSGTPIATSNAYQDVGANIVRVNVAQASVLQQRIANGERPLLIDLVPRWDSATINTQLSKIQGLRNSIAQAWNDARTAIQRNDSAIVAMNSDRQIRRERYKFRLWQITGFHPDDESRWEGLDTEAGRQAYLGFVENFVLQRTQNFDPTNPWFTQPPSGGFTPPAGDVAPTEISDLGFASLRMLQAFNDLDVARARIDAIPQQIAIEDRRNLTVNLIITAQGLAISALDASQALADSHETSYCVCGLASGVTYTPKFGSIVAAAQTIVRNLINTGANVGINTANSRALVENLLVEQGLLLQQLPSSVIQAQLAVNELRRLYAEAEQLVEDYEYHTASTDTLWYNDPELVFEQEAAEERYAETLQSYQSESYLLSLMLERAWVEPYEYPARDESGSYRTFSSNPAYDRFPDQESVFAVGDYRHVTDYTQALRDWNNFLISQRGVVTGGREPTLAGADKISYRQQILKLSDLEFVGRPGNQSFRNIRRFRAHILNAHRRAQDDNGDELRLDLAINLTELIEAAGNEQPIFLFGSLAPGDTSAWNRRVLGVGLELVGNNVTQGRPANPGLFNAQVFLHGNIFRESRFVDSQDGNSNLTITTNLNLYQRDPLEPTPFGTPPRYGIPVDATSGGLKPSPSSSRQMPLVNWPFWCDNWVISVPSGNAQFNWENIDDIVIYLFTEYGPPVSSATNYNWSLLN